MTQGKAQFTGAAGQYYLAYGLAVRQVIASLTLGNAPSVDVLASSSDGSRTLAFQVKRLGRSSKPSWGAKNLPGVFDSHAPPPSVHRERDDRHRSPRSCCVPTRPAKQSRHGAARDQSPFGRLPP